MEQTQQKTLRLLTAEQIAQRLAIGKSTAYLMMASGELPTVRIGTAVRVSERALEQWIEQKESRQSA